MDKLAKELKSLSWLEMTRISQHIADEVTHNWKHHEPVDRDSVAQILDEMASDILSEHDVEDKT